MRNFNILFASHPDFSGNAKSLYQYMKNNCPNLNLSWVVYEEENYNLLKDNNISCYKYESLEFKNMFESVDIVIFTHDELLELKKANQIYIFLGHGISGKKFGYFFKEEQLAVQDKRYLSLMHNNIDYIICSSELWQIIYHAAFNIDMKRILPLGTCRTDFIHTEDGKSNLKKCNIDTSKFNKVLMYLPTFRCGLGRENDGSFSENILNLEKYNESELEQFLIENNYLLIIKYHPYETNKREFKNSTNIIELKDEIITKNLLSLTEIINGIDLIIADYSSAFSDYMILDKPVCFLNNDLQEYRNSRGIIFDDIDFWSPGPYIKTIDDLFIEIEKLLKDKKYYQMERKKYVNINFGSNTKLCSKNVIKYLFNENSNLLEKNGKAADTELVSLYNENLDLKVNEINLKNENDYLIKLNNELKNELNMIYSSKGYRLIEKLRRILRR